MNKSRMYAAFAALACLTSGAQAQKVPCWKLDEPNSTYYKEGACPEGFSSTPPPVTTAPSTYTPRTYAPQETFEDRLTEKAARGLTLGLMFAVVVTLAYVVRLYWRRLAAARQSSAANTAKQNDFYALALQELEDGTADKATWARALAKSDGDPNRSRAAYIQLRVAALAKGDA